MGVRISPQRLFRKLHMRYVLWRFEHQLATEHGPLKYLLLPHANSDKLLVVFSGFSSAGKSAVYNYVSSFRELPCTKLFILDDFGPNPGGGSYYLGKQSDFFLERSVTQLIQEVATKLEISTQNIITAGSSKGGFAALLFAIKNNFQAAIAGAPQTKLGDYLSQPGHVQYLSYIMGNSNAHSRERLNQYLFDAANSSDGSTKVYLHVSSNDHHYHDHVLPLHDSLIKQGFETELEVADYEEHTMVGSYFAEFAKRCVTPFIGSHGSKTQ